MNDLDFKPVELINTSTQIIQQFVEMIKSSELLPGQCLPSEASLAKSFGTSRATVREALSGLKVLGVLKSVPGKGNFIKEPSIDAELDGFVEAIKDRSFLEALEARRAIEGEICFLAAKRRTDESLEAIVETLEQGRAVTDVDQFIKADYQFHLALAKASANGLFIQFIKEALLKLDQPYYNTIRVAEDSSDASSVMRVFGRSHDDHDAIYQAILEGDPDEARRHMLNHLQSAQQKYMEYRGK